MCVSADMPAKMANGLQRNDVPNCLPRTNIQKKRKKNKNTERGGKRENE